MPAVNNSPLINACRLWEQTSAKGNRYLTGRMGGVKILIMENTRPAEGDTSTHVLFFGEAPPRPHDAPQRTNEGQAGAQPRGKPKVQVPDDAVPF